MAPREGLPVQAVGPTEASPLLGDENAAARIGSVGDAENGHATPTHAQPEEGNPAMAAKMHLLIPAVGIGVSARPYMTLYKRYDISRTVHG